MENFTWEALPPRKKVKNIDKNIESLVSGEKEAQRVTGDSIKESIEKNITARSKINREHTTLQSNDGCAGEFYEYLDHTADVQCHAWGRTIVAAFENMAECMINYMTDIHLIDIDPEETQHIVVSGHDMDSLLYNFMNEILVKFISDTFCSSRLKITSFDREKFTILATLEGEIFDESKHSSGTEIKAITYSNLQIHEKEDRTDLFVIVDI